MKNYIIIILLFKHNQNKKKLSGKLQQNMQVSDLVINYHFIDRVGVILKIIAARLGNFLIFKLVYYPFTEALDPKLDPQGLVGRKRDEGFKLIAKGSELWQSLHATEDPLIVGCVTLFE